MKYDFIHTKMKKHVLFVLVFGIISVFCQPDSDSSDSDENCDDDSNHNGGNGHGQHNGNNNRYQANGCPEGWKLFQRARGPWCIGTFYSSDESNVVDFFQAQQKCQEHAAVLSGIESVNERDYIKQSLLSKWGPPISGWAWLGSKRNVACRNPSLLPSICENKLTCFDWTDGFTSGTAGFLWLSFAPDGQLHIEPDTGEPQSCMLMYITTDWRFGGLDDQWCNARTYGYVCGKQAEPN